MGVLSIGLVSFTSQSPVVRTTRPLDGGGGEGEHVLGVVGGSGLLELPWKVMRGSAGGHEAQKGSFGFPAPTQLPKRDILVSRAPGNQNVKFWSPGPFADSPCVLQYSPNRCDQSTAPKPLSMCISCPCPVKGDVLLKHIVGRALAAHNGTIPGGKVRHRCVSLCATRVFRVRGVQCRTSVARCAMGVPRPP